MHSRFVCRLAALTPSRHRRRRQDCRDTYVELRDRIVALEDPGTVAKADAMVRSIGMKEGPATGPLRTKRHVFVGALLAIAVAAGAAFVVLRRR